MIFGYLRRRAASAILAGAHDAMQLLASLQDPGGQPAEAPATKQQLPEEEAAKHLLALVAESAKPPALPSRPRGGAAATPDPDAPAPENADQAAAPAQQPRGPGRPRKYQEPPK